jgi:hypothetical protein
MMIKMEHKINRVVGESSKRQMHLYVEEGRTDER